jgi:hypothetical protein
MAGLNSSRTATLKAPTVVILLPYLLVPPFSPPALIRLLIRNHVIISRQKLAHERLARLLRNEADTGLGCEGFFRNIHTKRKLPARKN